MLSVTVMEELCIASESKKKGKQRPNKSIQPIAYAPADFVVRHMKDRMMKTCFLAIFIMISFNVFAYNSDVCFPGKDHHLFSPSGAHRFVWKEPLNQNDEHHLFYGTKGSEPRELHAFRRSVCIYWSPDERYFSITDYAGSNVAETYIYNANDPGHPINVTDLLPDKVLKHLKRAWHCYVEAVSWENNGLFVRVFGDGDEDPQGFDVTLKCLVEEDNWACIETTANK